MEEAKRRHGVRFKEDLPAEALREVTETSKDIIRREGFGAELDEILADPEELAHGIEVFTNSVNRIRVLALDRRVQDLQGQIEGAVSDAEKLELMTKKAKLAAELRELDPNYWASAARRIPGTNNSNESSR